MLRDFVLKVFTTLEPDDVRSTPMGVNGEDLMLSPAARKKFPYSVECKNVEKLNIWDAIKQLRGFAGKSDYTPLVVFKKNNEEPFAAVPLAHFMELLESLEKYKNELENYRNSKSN